MILTTLIEKGIGSTRPGTRAKALEILMEMVSADAADPVIAELGTFVTSKQSKLASAAVNAIVEILRSVNYTCVSSGLNYLF